MLKSVIMGEPDAELDDLLGEVRNIQDAARGVARAGAQGGDIVAKGEAAVAQSPWAKSLDFVAHGMGLVSHEAPRVTPSPMLPMTQRCHSRPAWSFPSRRP